MANRRRSRLHSDELKADAIAAASLPCGSMASVTLTLGINAYLLRRWVREAEAPPVKTPAKAAAGAPTFVAVQLPVPATPVREIRIDVRRGATTIMVAYPIPATAECESWVRELLRLSVSRRRVRQSRQAGVRQRRAKQCTPTP